MLLYNDNEQNERSTVIDYHEIYCSLFYASPSPAFVYVQIIRLAEVSVLLTFDYATSY